MRGLALFLLALGVVLGFVGLFGTIAVIAKLPAGGQPQLVAVFLVLDAIAAALLIVAVSVLRRTRPIGAVPRVVEGKVGVYPAGTPVFGTLGGVAYSVLYQLPVRGKNGRPSSLRVTVPVNTPGEFQVVPETWFDRLGKRLGLSVEVQTGDETFDAESYVRTDAVEFTREYLADPVKRIAILDVRRLGFPVVTLTRGTLTALWTGFDPHRDDKPDLVADAAARLVLLARDLQPHKPEFDNRAGRNRKKWQVVLWVFLGLFAATVFSLAAYSPTHGAELVGSAALVFIPAVPIFAFLSGWLLSGTSTSHYAWGWLMLGGLFLVPAGSAGSVGLLNGALDDSQPVTHTQVIVEKYTTRGKNSTNYHVKCASWRRPGDTESFQIGAAEYNAVVANRSHMVVVTRAGAIGVEWLESRRVAP